MCIVSSKTLLFVGGCLHVVCAILALVVAGLPWVEVTFPGGDPHATDDDLDGALLDDVVVDGAASDAPCSGVELNVFLGPCFTANGDTCHAFDSTWTNLYLPFLYDEQTKVWAPAAATLVSFVAFGFVGGLACAYGALQQAPLHKERLVYTQRVAFWAFLGMAIMAILTPEIVKTSGARDSAEWEDSPYGAGCDEVDINLSPALVVTYSLFGVSLLAFFIVAFPGCCCFIVCCDCCLAESQPIMDYLDPQTREDREQQATPGPVRDIEFSASVDSPVRREPRRS